MIEPNANPRPDVLLSNIAQSGSRHFRKDAG